MALKIKKNDQPLEERNLITVLFGEPGAWKTSTASTASKPLSFDTDRGIARSVQANRPDHVDMDDYPDFGKLLNYIKSDAFAQDVEEGGYESIIFDTVGTLLDNFMAPYLMKSNKTFRTAGGLTLAGWGALGTEFNLLLSRLRSLNLEVILVCHAKAQDEKAVSRYGLAVRGQSSDIIMAAADLVGYCYPDPELGQVIDFTPNHIHQGKNTAEIPVQVIPRNDSPEYPTFLADIIDKTKKKMTEGSKASLLVKEKVAKYAERLNEAESPEHYEAIIKDLGAEESDTVRKLTKKRFAQQMEFDGYRYDSTTKRVVSVEQPKEEKKMGQDAKPPETSSEATAATTTAKSKPAEKSAATAKGKKEEE